ncbi:CotH kinase family protein [Candidatus Saccharibacteria bacterium]|nr:CotH kinase family protein [Candidatus Saccharibacteria bacterium]
MKRLLNFLRDHLLEYFLITLLFVGVFYLAFTNGSFVRSGTDPNLEYVGRIFNESFVHKIEVEISGRDFADLLENPREKTRYLTSATIDGEKIADVAFSVRGNGSLVGVAEDETSNRYSYTLNFKKFDKSGSFFGLDKLILNNLYADPSYLKNHLAFKIATASGLNAPLTSFTELYINGELQGLYLAIESVSSAYKHRAHLSESAAIFHPVPPSIDKDYLYREAKYLPDPTEFALESDPFAEGYTSGGADLIYRGEEKELYRAIFDNASTKYSPADADFLVRGLESLSFLADPELREVYWNEDEVINFFVSNALAPSSDSYVGGTAQNYYLVLSNQKLSVLPWDYDRAFHFGEDSFAEPDATTALTDLAVDYPIDEPLLLGFTTDDRPLWRLVEESPKNLSTYHARLQSTLENFFFSGDCHRELDRVYNLIKSHVYSDPTRFSSTEEFEEEVEYLRRFLILRADSVQRQLWAY